MKLFTKQIYFILLIACCSLLTINYAKSELPINQEEFLSPDEAFKIDYNIVDQNHVKINWIIHPGYYLYMGMFEFKSLDEISRKWKKDAMFKPKFSKKLRVNLLKGWQQAIRKALA